MGTSADGLPYVGAMPEMPGMCICASFNGHGMVLCLKSAQALVDMMEDDKDVEWFPKALVVTARRFGKKFQGRLDMRAPSEALFSDRSDAYK